MIETGDSFGSIRYKLLRTTLSMLREDESEETELPIEVAVAIPPREHEEMVDSLKQELGEDDLPPLSIDTALSPDEQADPEDLDAVWEQESPPAQSSGAASSSSVPLPEEPPLKRSATAWLTDAASSSSTAVPAVVLPRWEPQGKPVLDASNQECAHYRRRSPALNTVTWSGQVSSTTRTSTSSYSQAQSLLSKWLSARPGLLESFASVEACPYPWSPGPNDTDQQVADLHAWGLYIYCKLSVWIPKPRADIDVVSGRSSLYNQDLEGTIHSSSMYSVHRSVMKGLLPGPLPGKGNMRGVYVYRRSGRSLAISSSGYAVYSWIGGEFLASPRYDIAAELYRAGEDDVGKVSVGDGQLCLKPGMYYLRGIYFHVLTRSDIARGPPTWCQWDEWYPEHELPAE